jgi:hypothetical protein
MSDNKMVEVAKLFGKELNEEFIINEHISRYCILYEKRRKVTVFDPKIGWTTEYETEFNPPEFHHKKCKFTKNGLASYNEYHNYWQQDEFSLSDLLTGKATIVGEQKTHVKRRKKLI